MAKKKGIIKRFIDYLDRKLEQKSKEKKCCCCSNSKKKC